MIKLPRDTPSYMAFEKSPLRKVEGGYGFMGTLEFDVETKEHTRCHVCGYFYKQLGNHIRAHKIGLEDYKDKFSLGMKVSLAAPQSRKPIFQRWQSLSEEQRKEHLAKMREGYKKRLDTGRPTRKKALYWKNVEDRCPDQLLDKIERLAKKLGRTPTSREYSKEYGSSFLGSVLGTYGTWGNALKIVKMAPKTSGYGNRYTKESIIQILLDFQYQHERQAMSTDINRGFLPSNTAFKKYFGSFIEAKRAAYGDQADMKVQIITKLRDFRSTNKREAKTSDLGRPMPDYKTVQRYFGSWKEARGEAYGR